MTPNLKFPNRQIHLDFHTSGLIPNVGKKFNADQFASVLKAAHVEGICVFSRCHHGYTYHPTQVGTEHPHLAGRDLLGGQLKALKEANITSAIYTTICWDELAAQQHPEWQCRTQDNRIMKMNTHPESRKDASLFAPGWTFVCWNSPYRNYLRQLNKELLENYDAEFLFLDILFTPEPCVCQHCIARMQRHGLDPENPEDQMTNSLDSAREFMKFMNESIHSINPRIQTFYNSRLKVTGTVHFGSRPELPHMGVIAIESLPSGHWGYDHFPIFGKYFQNLDKPTMSHTGKFQKTWGDFGGLKHLAALDYENMRILSHGMVACVGDQLPPEGALDPATYQLIGESFKKIKEVESVLLPSSPIDEIGVLFTNQGKGARWVGTDLIPETGALKLLTQGQYQFSFIDEASDFSTYALLILPDRVTLTETLKDKLNQYQAQGGKLLLSYQSGLNETNQFGLDGLDILIEGDYPYSPYYAFPLEELKQYGVEDTDHVQYLGGKKIIIANSDHTVYAKICDPYFNRTWDHFCSHMHAPPANRTEFPEVVYNNKNAIYIASPIFSCYQKFSSKFCKALVTFAIEKLLLAKLVKSNLPSTAEVTFRKNTDNQMVLTILHYITQRRAENIDIVEDVIPLFNIQMDVHTEKEISRITDVRRKQNLEFQQHGTRVKFTIPKIEGFIVLTLE